MVTKDQLNVAQAVVNNSANQTSPRSPLHGCASVFDRRGARAKGSQLAPLLVLTRFEAHKQLTRNQSHGVTPFWHNDTPLSGNSYFWRTASSGAKHPDMLTLDAIAGVTEDGGRNRLNHEWKDAT